ncbi:MAG: hypothetical protein R3250_12180 [Melioribacteraceae bacterium]|nr:hypothetical protein [Melioribacteraceae bacterium]
MSQLALMSFLGLFFYVAVIGFIVWVAITIIKSQQERNRILREISEKLGRGEFNNL